ncbi:MULTISPECIES: TetR/AcrR family transcriptional regulator [unclassified Streptomyces]|uniref:TetR/AcrR family transcriptional regulator n=1 Tax=unclassified Streptomyces TaxID=2593676 RepID=UPI002366EF23|nr:MULTISPECIES: TetR/AcrR family transcriptional regulator [unclassified Streptomyces]MDF3143726.1 helix-turn-helix domain containing protein [Streptomyces sp. T21Q-yed]WDF38856.1 helix-turn-helix domain containing protein [Streptomyces sp. T12]
MTAETPRRLRADAARNSEKILRAARELYAESGPDASLEEIARRAGVGIATLYRRFPNKEELVRAALDQKVGEEMSPAISRALEDSDPLRGLVTLWEAAVSFAAREQGLLGAVRNAGSLASEISEPFYEALILVTRRAQIAGRVRADIVPDDLHRITVMLLSVLTTVDPDGDGWKRYITLVLDGLAPAQPTVLKAPEPLRQWPKRGARPA